MARRKGLAGALVGWLTVGVAVAAPLAWFATREEVVEVTAAQAARGRVEQTVSAIASGTVMAGKDARISSEIMGKIARVPVEEGDSVEAGDLLVELHHEELDAQVRLAAANLQAGRALGNQAVIGAGIYEDVSATQASQAQAQMEQAQADLGRLQALYDQKAISQADLDKARLAARVAEEGYAAAVANRRQTQARQEEVRSSQANVEQLEAALEVAEAMRAKAFIRAPFPGTVSTVYLDEGESVTPGVPLVQLVQDEERYVEAPFDEANAAQIRPGQRVRINLDAYRGVDFPGRVTYVSPTVTLNRDFSRTLNVKVHVEEGWEKFIPGMSADVIVLLDEKDDVLYVPSEALIRQRHAYVIDSTGRAVRRELEPGIGDWNRTEILRGLEAGETYITSVSVQGLREGVKVKVVEAIEAP